MEFYRAVPATKEFTEYRFQVVLHLNSGRRGLLLDLRQLVIFYTATSDTTPKHRPDDQQEPTGTNHPFTVKLIG